MKRRDKRGNYDKPRVDKESGDFRYTPDIFHSVLVVKTQVLAKAHPYVIAIQQVGMTALRHQFLLKRIG